VELSDQLHAYAALLSWSGTPAAFQEETEDALKPFWALWSI
jgi:hypothetical protein